jgi:N-acetylmuramoyl-L-alanine amidase
VTNQNYRGAESRKVQSTHWHDMVAWNKDLLESKYNIYLTKSTDTLISLDDRAELAKHLKPDIFISLHFDHTEDTNIKGIELYIYGTSDISLVYASSVSAGPNQKLGLESRKVKTANFQVL